jgi:large subunit ribosomal protein L23
MALFGKKKAAVKESAAAPKTATKKVAVEPAKLSAGRDLSSVIRRPRVTEKAVHMTEQNVYTFEVRSNATKYDIRDAVREHFGVTPKKINIVRKQARSYLSRMRGRRMKESGFKKAYVYLNKGDRIDLV